MKQMNEQLARVMNKAAKYKYVWIVLLFGIVLMLLPTSGEEDSSVTVPEVTVAEKPMTEGFSVEAEEKRLAEILSSIKGAGECRVLLSVASTEEMELARDDGGTVILSGGSGVENIVTIKTLYPVYQGAVIVCAGADSPAVKYDILSAVMTYTGLGSDKISICAMYE